MIKTKGILHVTIPVSDPARSRAFYTDILGLEFVSQVPKDNPHFVFLKSGADYVVLGREASRGRFSDIIHHAFMVDGAKRTGGSCNCCSAGLRRLCLGHYSAPAREAADQGTAPQ